MDHLPTEPPPPERPAKRPGGIPETEGSQLPRNVAATLAVLIPFGGILFLFLDRREPFVRFHSAQSLLLWVLAFAIWLTVEIANFILGGIPLLGYVLLYLVGLLNWIVTLAWLCAWGFCVYTAYRHKEWPLPYLGAIARRYQAALPK